MRKKFNSNESAYGYSHKNYSHKTGKSSSFMKEKASSPLKWIIASGLALSLVAGGTYAAINIFEEENLQNTNEEVRNMNVSIKGEEKVKVDWLQNTAQIAQTESAPVDKYEQLLEIALAYKVTEREYQQFKTDILATYEAGDFLNFENDEVALTNIFKAYVLNEYTNIKTDLQFKLFIDNYLDAISYVYREYEKSDSEFVKGKVAVLNGAFEKLKNAE